MAWQCDDLDTNSTEQTESADLIKLVRKQDALRKLPPDAFSRSELHDPKRPMPIELIEQYLSSLVIA